VNVDVDSLRVYFKAEVCKRMTSLGQKCGIGLLNRFADIGRLNGATVDEQKKRRLLHMIISIGCPSMGLEPPSLVSRFKFY
jgi:hypothetical protein